MGLNEVVEIFAEGLGVSFVGVCGVGILFLLVITFGCSLFGGDEGESKKESADEDGGNEFWLE